MMPTESYKVEAVLSARDEGLTATAKKALASIKELTNNANRKIKVSADARSAQDAISKLKDTIDKVPKRTTTEVSARDNATSIVQNLVNQLRSVNGAKAKAHLDADSTDADLKISDATGKVKAFGTQNATASLNANTDALQSKIAGAKSDVEGFNATTASATISANTSEADNKIASVKSSLDSVANSNVSATVSANTTAADSEIGDLMVSLNQIADMNPKPNVSLNDNASSDLERIITLLSNIEKTVFAVVELQDNATGPLVQIQDRLDSLEQTHDIPVNLSGDAGAQAEGLGGKIRDLFSQIKGGMLLQAGQNLWQKLSSGLPTFINGMQQSGLSINNTNSVLDYYNRTAAKSSAQAAKWAAQQKKDMADIQQYASRTIYSTIDMDQAYAQLTGTGVKGAAKVVEAFGNIAAASTNPQQAMSTIMTQMTQMAANGKADWQDMKLVFEQAGTLEPEVARQLGMSVADMQDAMSKGKISSQEMLDAVVKAASAGGNVFGKMAQQFQTVPQAIDGITEDVQHKMLPVFSSIQSGIIDILGGVNDAIDNSGIGKSFEDLQKPIQGFFDGLKKSGALKTFDADIQGTLRNLANFNESLAKNGNLEKWGEDIGNVFNTVSNALSPLGPMIQSVTSAIGQFNDKLAGIKIGNTNLRDIGLSAIAAIGGIGLLSAKIGGIRTIFSKLGGLNPFKNLFDKLPGQMQKGEDSSQKGAGIIQRIFEHLGNGIEAITSVIGKAIAGVFKGFADVPVAGLLKGAAVIGIFELALAGLGAMRGLIHPVFQDLVSGINQLVSVAGPQLPNVGKLFEDCGKAIKDAFDGVGDIIKGALDGVADIIKSTGDAAKKAGEGFKKMADGAKELSQVNFGSLAANLTVLTGGNIVNGFQNFLNTLTGNTFEEQAKGLNTLADSLGKISKATGAVTALSALKNFKINVDQFNQADQAIKNLTNDLRSLSGGGEKKGFSLSNLFGGGDSKSGGGVLSGLGAQIKNIGAMFATLSARINPMLKKMQTLKTTMASLTGGGKKGNPFAGLSNTLTLVSRRITQISASAKSLRASFAGLNITKSFAGVSATLTRVSASMRRMGTAARAGIVAGMNAAAIAARSGVTRIVAAIQSGSGRAMAGGRRIGTSATNGLRSGLAPAPGVARSAVNQVIAAMQGHAGAAYSAGSAIGQGLANGLNSQLGAVQAAVNAINSILDGIKKSQKIASPSKVQYANGRFVVMGLANGMLSMKDYLNRAVDTISSFSIMPSMPAMSTAMAGDTRPNFDVTLHSDIYLDQKRVGYGVAKPVSEKNARDAKLANLVRGYR